MQRYFKEFLNEGSELVRIGVAEFVEQFEVLQQTAPDVENGVAEERAF